MDTPAKTRVTFEEYAALPETNQIVELIGGEIIVTPPLYKHQKALLQIIKTLTPLLPHGEMGIAPTGLHFDDDNSFEPDLFWVSPENTQCFLEENGRYWHGAPDLVIEILWPSTETNDRGIKYETYERFGVREYWLIDVRARFAEVYRHEGGKFQRQGVFKPNQPFVSAVLGGATIAIQSWFSE